MHRTSALVRLAMLCMVLPHTLAAQELPFGISLPSSLNFATSPSPVGSGARAQGQALAFIGVADDATAASHNPGGLVQLELPEASIVGSYFLRVEQQDITRADTIVENQTLDSFALNYLSMVYPFEFLQRNWVVSLNFQRLFDLQGVTDVASRFNTMACACEGIQRVHSRQDGGLFTISPAVAAQITPTFAVGMAFNIWPDLFDNGWDQDVTVQGEGRVTVGLDFVPFVAKGSIREKFAFEGFNVTAGFLWNISSRVALGGVFRSPFTARVTRTHASTLTVSLKGQDPVTTSLSFRETLDMDMPLVYGLGVSIHVIETSVIALRFSLDVSRIHWSDFRLEDSTRDDVLLVDNGAPTGKGRAVLNGEADDTTTVRLGVQYQWLPPQISFRAGGFYDPEPGARGTDAFWGVSFGTGFVLKEKVVVDFAYTFRTGSVRSEATDTSVYQHEMLISMIYYF